MTVGNTPTSANTAALPPVVVRGGGAGFSYAAALLAIMLLALALRLHLLAEQSVWWDEALAAWAARQDLLSIARWTSTDVHPPLYFWLLHGWRLFIGESAFGLRLLSVLAGVLLVAAVSALGRFLGGRQVGLLGAGLAAVEPFLVWWSQEMRMYELAALLATLSIVLTLRLTASTAGPGRLRPILWVAYVVVTVAALYTLYLAVLVIMLEAAYVLLWAATTPGRRRDLVAWAAALATTLALFAPWLVYAAVRMHTWSAAAPWSGAQFVRVYVALLGMGVSTNIESYLLPSLVFAGVSVIAIAGLLATRRTSHWRQIALLVACLLILPVAVFALTMSRGLFYTPNVEARYLLLFAPAVYVLLAWGLAVTGRHAQVVGILIVTVLAAGGLIRYYGSRYLADDYQTLVATLRSYAQPNDAVLLHSDSDWPVFAYHYDKAWTGIPYGETTTASAVAARLAATGERQSAVWLVVTPDALRIDGPGHVEAYLQQKLPRRTEYLIGDKRLVLFARAGEQRTVQMTPVTDRVEIDLGQGVTITGYEQAIRRARPGDRVYASVYWRGSACGATLPLTIQHEGQGALASLSLPLCEKEGVGDLYRTLLRMTIAPDWPAGSYDLRVGDTVLGRLAILAAAIPSGASTADISHPLNVDFDGKITLRGFDIDPSAPAALYAGDTVKVTLYWQAQQTIDQSYTVFVHLLGQTYNARLSNFLWGQHDGIPGTGTSPTTSWRVGTLVADQHVVTVDAQAPEGEYQVEVGLYDAVSPATPRLVVRDAQGMRVDDRVIVQTLRVER